MKTVKELENYIKKQAILYFTADDAESFEIIEYNTFRAILEFAVHQDGLLIEGYDLPAIIEESANGEEDRGAWDVFPDLLEIFDELETNKQMPKATLKLYKAWKKAFWEPNF